MVRQLDGIDELANAPQAAYKNQLHQQAQKIDLVDSRSRNIGRFGGNALQKGLQRPLFDRSQRHQVVAQTSPDARLALQRRGNILLADQARLDQQIAQSHSSADSALLQSSF